MNFILHAPFDAQSIASGMGKAEYSYYFVMREYEPALSALGTLHYVNIHDGAQAVDDIYLKCQAQGQACYFLSFTPPHKTISGLQCPIICVFAWEFPDIPNRVWSDEPRNDWRTMLTAHGRTITLSQHTARAVRASMGDDFPVLVAPTPVWGRQPKVTQASDFNPIKTHFNLLADAEANRKYSQTIVVDSRALNLSPHMLEHATKTTASASGEMLTSFVWAANDPQSKKVFHTIIGQYTDENCLRCDGTQEGFLLFGPYVPLNKGQYKIDVFAEFDIGEAQHVVLDAAYRRGEVTLNKQIFSQNHLIDAAGKTNHLFQLTFDLQEDCQDFEVRVWVNHGVVGEVYAIEIKPVSGMTHIDEATNDTSAIESAPTVHTLAQLKQQLHVQQPYHELFLDGVVYTSVFNPKDGRKNWVDIVTAFCFTFRNERDVTLILKTNHNDFNAYQDKLLMLLARLSPFSCRVICVHGYLDDEQYTQLIRASSFYVNASSAEGLCIPILEFLCCGVPVIAPNHTAMADYMGKDIGFVVDSHVETTSWPHDPRQLRVTSRHRINWESLCQAYRDSYALTHESPQAYSNLANNGIERMSTYASEETFTTAFSDFIQRTSPAPLVGAQGLKERMS